MCEWRGGGLRVCTPGPDPLVIRVVPAAEPREVRAFISALDDKVSVRASSGSKDRVIPSDPPSPDIRIYNQCETDLEDRVAG